MKPTVVLAVLVVVAACGGEGPGGSSGVDGGTHVVSADGGGHVVGMDAGSRVDAGSYLDAGAPNDGGSTAEDAGVASGGAGIDDAGEPAVQGPENTTPVALKAFVKSGAYQQWRAEPSKHPSTGPHGGDVRTFLNDVLYASLKAGNAVHPPGSVVVKELFGAGSSVTGHAVDVKDSNGIWVFYEGFNSSDYENPYYFTGTNNLCANCHAAGDDYVLTSAAALP